MCVLRWLKSILYPQSSGAAAFCRFVVVNYQCSAALLCPAVQTGFVYYFLNERDFSKKQLTFDLISNGSFPRTISNEPQEIFLLPQLCSVHFQASNPCTSRLVLLVHISRPNVKQTTPSAKRGAREQQWFELF